MPLECFLGIDGAITQVRFFKIESDLFFLSKKKQFLMLKDVI